jgi:SAM-dependent methyltransferase
MLRHSVRSLLQNLPPGSRVLDLGARSGSFSVERDDLLILRLDLEIPAVRKSGIYVSGDAARMPFAARSFDAIVANHSLEHFCDLQSTLGEMARIVKPGGALYVAVPDASTLTDRIYRWLGKGGGHVNAFRKPEDVTGPVVQATGLAHRSTTVLYSSLSFLNAHNFTDRPPRKIALFAWGNEYFLAALVALLRRADRLFGTRLSVYGWAFYFGDAEPEGCKGWQNVCVRCGAGSPIEYLRSAGAVRKWTWRCPACGGFNLL